MATTDTKNWAIGTFEIGNITDCMFACCLPCIVIPLTRSTLDGSSCCFNFFCLNGVVMRWIVRTGYEIEGGGFVDDCVIPYCCCCFSINQAYQTVKQNGKLSAGGREQNLGKWMHGMGGDNISAGNFFYAFCCFSCATGSVLKDGIGMDFLVGCCCANCFLSRNLLRYHYRISGDDCMEECATPAIFNVALCCFTACVGFCCWCCLPCLLPVGMIPLVLFLSTQLEEVHGRGGSGATRANYIIGYEPPEEAPAQASAVATPGMVPGTAVYVAAPQPTVVVVQQPPPQQGTVVQGTVVQGTVQGTVKGTQPATPAEAVFNPVQASAASPPVTLAAATEPVAANTSVAPSADPDGAQQDCW